MKKEVAEIWVQALRSGKYKQGQGALRTGDAYCCLGVLCDLYNSDNWKNVNRGYFVYEGMQGHLSDNVKDWSGLRSYAGNIFKGNRQNEMLMTYNDTEVSFEEIANIIEQEWENL